MRTTALGARAWTALLLTGGLLIAALLAGASAAQTATAKPAEEAAGDECRGRGIPNSQISVQIWTFASYIGFGEEEENQMALEETLVGLSEIGYRNVEPFSFNGFTATEFKGLLKENGLKAPSRHGSTDEATWDQHLADAKVLKQKFTGSGGSAAPGIDTYEDTLATAETLNRLGKRSVKNGTGKVFVHNHQGEFRTKYEDPDTGQMKSAWKILVENTDKRWVAFQLDVLWAADGGADPVRLLEKYGKRIKLLHIKDGTEVEDPANATPVPLGEGEMEFKPILKAAKGKVRYYVYEQDPPFDDPEFDPFASAEAGFDYLSCVRI